MKFRFINKPRLIWKKEPDPTFEEVMEGLAKCYQRLTSATETFKGPNDGTMTATEASILGRIG